MPYPPMPLLVRGVAAAALLTLATAASAASFEAVALSGSLALPFAAGASSAYAIDLRQPTLAEDGWVGFAAASSFLVGQPGEVRRVLSAGEALDLGTVSSLRAMRVDDGQRVALTLSLSSAPATQLHYTGAADGRGAAALAKVPSAGTTAVYNRPGFGGAIGFELLPGGQQLVHAANASGTSFEAGRLAVDGGHSVQVRSGSSATRILGLPTLGAPGVGTPAAGRSWASVQAVGGDAGGRSYLYGKQSGSGFSVNFTPVVSNLVEVRPDGTQVSLLHPGSRVPGVDRPALGIADATAQFASNGAGTIAFRADFGIDTTDQRKLYGAVLRYDPAAALADSRLGVVALPGDTVPGLGSGSGTPVRFGHQLTPDSGASLSALSMLPDLLALDSARGLAINHAGSIAFVSAITAAPASAGYGVFLSQADGSFATLATSGSVTAGLAPGVEGTFAKFHDVTVNGSGLVVFSATLTGAAGRRGLWYGHDAGDLQLLVAEGQTIEVLPGVRKTVGRLDTGLHELADTRISALDDGLNNAGQFAFSVNFTDGTQAVLRTALVGSVPEPGAWALWLAGLAGLGWRARRRRPG